MFVYTQMCLRTCIHMCTVYTHIYVPYTLLLTTALGSLTTDIPCTNSDSYLDIHCIFFAVKN